jgi:hypothetical protein
MRRTREPADATMTSKAIFDHQMTPFDVNSDAVTVDYTHFRVDRIPVENLSGARMSTLSCLHRAVLSSLGAARTSFARRAGTLLVIDVA